jgi:hypothetical protein
MITQFIRRGGTKRRGGVMVAFVSNDDPTIQIGFSLCNKIDKFDQFMGTEMAVIRAERWDKFKTIPTFVIKMVDPREVEQIYKFIVRAGKYFQKHNLPNWAETFRKYYER